MNTAAHRPASTNHYTGFDGLRGLLTLAIAAMHYAPEACRGAWIGVDIFFILSGFLMQHAPVRSLGEFAKNRFIRLYPMHLFSLLVFALALGAAWVEGASIPVYKQGYLYSFLTNIFLLQDSPLIIEGTWNSPSWFVSTLFWSSLFCFLVETRLKSNRIRLTLEILLVILSYSYLGITFATLDLHHTNVDGWLNLSFLRGTAGLMLGALTYRLAPFFKELFRKYSWTGNGLALFYAAILGIYFFFDPANIYYEILICVLAAPVLCALTDERNIARNFLSASWLRWLGNMSYAMYLNQYTLKGVARFFHCDSLVTLPLYLVCLILFSALAQALVRKTIQFFFHRQSLSFSTKV